MNNGLSSAPLCLFTYWESPFCIPVLPMCPIDLPPGAIAFFVYPVPWQPELSTHIDACDIH